MYSLTPLLLSSLYWLGASSSPIAPSVPPTVVLSSGVVVGSKVTVPSSVVAVNQYLGIPFASPPVRFSPPTAVKPWTTPLQATSLPPICIQEFPDPAVDAQFEESVFGNVGGPPQAESEDCLYLNVYTPATAPPIGGRTVMVWIYGGNLQFGGSTDVGYNGSSFAANQDVIIVNFNYRTNAFGFPGSPELPSNQRNLGFLDQRFALQWVQQNIKAFGGDPTKVTIFGESAGGYSVKQLVALPPSPLPFRAAIMESEAISLAGTPASSWAALVSGLNCASAVSQLACVRAASASDIKNIEVTQGLAFPPTFENQTAEMDTAHTFAAGKGSKVPFLIGTNENEGRPFAYEVILVAGPDVDIAGYLISALGTQFTDTINKVVAAYPVSTYGSNYLALSAIITDYLFDCQAAGVSIAAAAGGYNVWRYLFNASFPNSQPFPQAGVYHSSEIAEVFGTYNPAGATAQQIQISKYMQTTWANFAKNPTAGPGWPKVGSNNNAVLGAIGSNGSSGETTVSFLTTDTKCPLFLPIYAVTGI